MLFKQLRYSLGFRKADSEVPQVIIDEIDAKIPKEKARTITVLSFRQFSKQSVVLAGTADDNGEEFIVSEGMIYEKKTNLFFNPYTMTPLGTNIGVGAKDGFPHYWVAAVSENEAKIIIMIRK